MRPGAWGVLAAASAALTLSALLAFVGGGAAGVSAPPPGKTNVLVLMTDDQTVESMRVMANVNSLLARQGTTFVNNFASYPLCCPSRATYITGQYGHNHTIMGNTPPNGGYDKLAPSHSNSLPAWLQQAGYTTVHLGKYLNGYPAASRPNEVPAGWTEWYGSVDPTTYRFYNYTLNENGRRVTYGTGAVNYQADVYNRKAVEIVRRLAAGSKPFFLSVAFLAPHNGAPRDSDDPANFGTPSPAPRHRNAFANQPLPTPPSLNEADVSDKPAAIRNRPLIGPGRLNAIREGYQQRLESLLAVDEAIRDILSALSATGQLERTLVIFTADNGFFHGEHRVQTGKVLVYEPSVRVPLILRGPGVPRGVQRTNLAANVDLAATILDATKARPGRRLDGISLLRFTRDRLRRSGRDILLETPTYSAIRTPRHVFVQHSTGEQELYDLIADPHQLTSLHADARLAPLKADLARRLATLRVCAGDACRRGPHLRLQLRYRRGGGGCTRSNIRLRVGGSAASRISSVVFYRGTRAIKRDARGPYTALVRRSRVGRRATTLRAVVTLKDSRSASLERALRRCS